jgi:ABC-2 type transport system ATP-binding protein
MIEVGNLTKKFGDLTAVDDLTLQVNEGEVFGLLGPNGAGKTTTIRMLCCLISKTSGKVKINDFSLDNKADHIKIRKIIGLLPENVGLYEDMTAYKNLEFYGKMYDIPSSTRKDRIQSLLKQMDLWQKKDVLVGTYSKGMKQKLALARALIHDPQILFLDEPTANLDPEAAKMVRDTLLELKKEKRTIFLNTHMLDEADRICDKIGILNTKLKITGTRDELHHSILGTKSLVEVDAVTENILASIKNLGLTNFTIKENRIIIDVVNPKGENPKIIKAIMNVGGKIQSIHEIVPSLEDIYLKEVKSDNKNRDVEK